MSDANKVEVTIKFPAADTGVVAHRHLKVYNKNSLDVNPAAAALVSSQLSNSAVTATFIVDAGIPLHITLEDHATNGTLSPIAVAGFVSTPAGTKKIPALPAPIELVYVEDLSESSSSESSQSSVSVSESSTSIS